MTPVLEQRNPYKGNPPRAWVSVHLIPSISLATNFGSMQGGWVHVVIPEIQFDQKVLAYASDAVVQSAQKSHPAFQGMAGLPLFRLLEYSGDADWFCIRQATITP